MRRTESKKTVSSPNRTMARRTLFLMAVCGILAFAVLAARLYILQVRDHDKYEELAISQQLRETGSSAERGTIYDCNMNILAMSANVDNVYLSPAEIAMYKEDRELIADKLSEILGLDREDILKKPRITARGMSPLHARSKKRPPTRYANLKTNISSRACALKATQSDIIRTRRLPAML